MATVDRDSKFIAETLRALRKARGWTQENLAQEAGLSVRTIEKVESGRHCPNEQTLRCIARALGVDIGSFDKTSPEQKTHVREQVERLIRKTLLISVRPVRTAREFLSAFSQRHAFRFDYSAVTDEDDIRTVAEIIDWISDLSDVWVECSMSQKLEYATSFVDLCKKLEEKKYYCYMGHHRQQECIGSKRGAIFDVGVMSIRLMDEVEEEQGLMVHLEDDWETLVQDRPSLDEILRGTAFHDEAA